MESKPQVTTAVTTTESHALINYRLDQLETNQAKGFEEIKDGIKELATEIRGKFEKTDERLLKTERDIDRMNIKAGMLSGFITIAIGALKYLWEHARR